MTQERTSAVTRLLSRIEIDPETGCWEWQGYKDRQGYGVIGVGSKHYFTHRFAFLHLVGGEMEGLNVCHRCDNRPCCNPEHLFLGTHADNVADMMAKGRGEPRIPLDLVTIGRLMRAGLADKRLAKVYGVDSTVMKDRRALLGIPPRRLGRVTVAEAALHDQLIAELTR